MMKKFFLILFLFATKLFAQETLSLTDAINIALQKNFSIRLSKNNVQANTIYNNYGYAGGLPLITGSATDNEQLATVHNKNSDTTFRQQANNTLANSLSASIDGSILLYNGMYVVSTKHKLEELETQSKYYLNAQTQEIIDSVMQSYYNIVRQQSYMHTIDESIDAAQQKLSIVKTQQSVGMANNADLFQSQLDLNALFQSKQSQQLIIDQAKADLLNTLTLKADSSFNISDTIIVDSTLKLDDILNKLQNNPDLLAADIQIKINRLTVKQIAAQRYPSLRLGTGYSIDRTQYAKGSTLLTESYGPYAGLTLGVPVFNGTIYKRQQKVAEINVTNANIQKQQLQNNLTTAVIKLYQAYTNNFSQLQTQKQNYLLAKQLQVLVLQKFNLRQATIVDVKNAEQTFTDAAFGLVNLSFAAKSAEIELKYLTYSLSY